MPPLLFLHGIGGGRAAWDTQVGYFAQSGYRAIAWNQPGYGDAPMVDPYDLEQIARSLEQLIVGMGDAPVVSAPSGSGGSSA